MIEELLVKNAQLVDENSAAQQVRGPFDANDSVNVSGYGAQMRDRGNKGGSYHDNPRIGADETFTAFANLKSIEYIHQQFYAQRNSREAQLDTKNACFSDIYLQVDDLVKKLY